ncbi:MAG: hypothetical protein IJM65_07285 [Bacteroidales bacterium]|nr:hypothetical protein [Bacteroidales bacterium]
MTITEKHTGKKRTAIIVAGALLIATTIALLLPRTRVAETIQRQAAKIRRTEYIPQQRNEIEKTIAYNKMDSLHSLFRNSFRFHYQGIGRADFPDSSRLLMISEPPPYFEADSLTSIFKGFNIRIERKKHRIGYDGHITDLLVTIENATEENMRNRIRKLSEALYYSDYKCPVIQLQQPGKRRYFTKNRLDYRLSLQEINNWFLEEPELFIRLEDTAKRYNLQELLDKRQYGRYFSLSPGFVAWIIPKHHDLSEHLEEIRPFTLDADLILAAISDSASLAIIGREREAALEELPPLQVETILLLASIRDKELSQSLDINDLMAGKMGNGRDWCPTYLSKELENTEFGDLLTMTDVILKDWSESGTIQEAYYRYPHPGYYPFQRPLFEWLGVEQLVYNWNTDDAMFAIDRDGKTIYAPNRTGALPVSYFLSQERSTSPGRKYEQKAYGYFAGTGNTDLARVVQYTILYQLFIDNDIRYGGRLENAFPKNKPYLLANPVKRLLEQITALSEDSIRHISDSVMRQQFEGFHRARILKEIAEADEKYGMQHSDEEKEEICRRVLNDQKQALVQQFRQVRQLLASLSEEERTRLERFLAYPRGTRVRDAATYRTYRQAETVKKLFHMMGKNHMALIGTELKDVRNSYCAQLADKSAPYLKTPSCVVTFHDFHTTGGHNLSSKIHRVNSMTGYRSSGAGTSTEYYPAPQQDKAGTVPDKNTSVPEKATPPVTKKNTTTPDKATVTKTTVSKTTGSKTTASKPTSQKSSQSTSGVRSRSSVIPAQARSHRGL